MIVGPPMLSNLSGPDVSHITVMCVLACHSRHAPIMSNFCLERFDKALNHLITIDPTGQIKPSRKPQVNPECKNPRILLQSPTCRITQPIKILLNEWTFINLNRHSTIAVTLMDNQVSVFMMTSQLLIPQEINSYPQGAQYFLTTINHSYQSGI